MWIKRNIVSLWFILLLCSCHDQPPYNNFEPYNSLPQQSAKQVGGGATGNILRYHRNSQAGLLQQFKRNQIQFIQYGDTITLIMPTDRYFTFNSPHFNEASYAGLLDVVKFVKLYPKSIIYIACFTDNVGSVRHKNKLSQARAETMLTYLWANGIKAARLAADGYGDRFNVADNHLMHGSAQNRHLEIQIVNDPCINNCCD